MRILVVKCLIFHWSILIIFAIIIIIIIAVVVIVIDSIGGILGGIGITSLLDTFVVFGSRRRNGRRRTQYTIIFYVRFALNCRFFDEGIDSFVKGIKGRSLIRILFPTVYYIRIMINTNIEELWIYFSVNYQA